VSPVNKLTGKVRKRVETMEEIPEELEKVIELALTEKDQVIAAEILQNVELALKEINIAEIEALAAEHAKLEMQKINLDSIMETALKQADQEIAKELETLKDIELISAQEGLEIAKEAMAAASEAMKVLNMDSIIEFSLQESMNAIKEIDIDKIVIDAIKDIEIDTDNERLKIDSATFKEMGKELDEMEENN